MKEKYYNKYKYQLIVNSMEAFLFSIFRMSSCQSPWEKRLAKIVKHLIEFIDQILNFELS